MDVLDSCKKNRKPLELETSVRERERRRKIIIWKLYPILILHFLVGLRGSASLFFFSFFWEFLISFSFSFLFSLNSNLAM